MIELLVVIAIIAVLLGLLLAAVQKVRESANVTKCRNNMRQIALAALNYELSQGALPPAGYSGCHVGAGAFLLPYLEYEAVYRQIPSEYFSFHVLGTQLLYEFNPVALAAARNRLPIFVCPSDNPYSSESVYLVNFAEESSFSPPLAQYPQWDIGRSNYLPCGGWITGEVDGPGVVKPLSIKYAGVYTADMSTRITDITDGTSNTIGWMETTGATSLSPRDLAVSWMGGCSTGTANGIPGGPTQNWFPSSFHTHIVNVSMCDGSVHSFHDGITFDSPLWIVLQRLAGRQDGEVAGVSEVE